MVAYKTKRLSADSRGNFQRDLGRRSNGKPHRFYLGKDESAAELRKVRLERLWDIVSGKYGSWDETTLPIGQAVAKGLATYQVPMDERRGIECQAAYSMVVNELAGLLAEVVTILPEDRNSFATGRAALQGMIGDHAAQMRKATNTAQAVLDDAASRAGVATAPITGEVATLHECLTAYAEQLKAKPELIDPGTRQTTAWGVVQLGNVERLKEHHENVPIVSIGLPEIKGLVDHWKCRPNVKGKEKPIGVSTAKHHVWQLKNFFDWLDSSNYQWTAPSALHKISLKIPRTAAERERIITVEQVDVWSVDELKMLYLAATEIERIYLLLGLNCGFGPGEFGTLKLNHIFLRQKHPHEKLLGLNATEKQNWIRRVRPKSSVYGEWVLWPETVKAIEWATARRAKLPYYSRSAELMVTDQGTPYMGMTSGNNKAGRVANFWNLLVKRVQRTDKTFRALPAKSLRKTAGNMIRGIGGGEVQGIFLAHGKVVATDNLTDVYSNRPFQQVFSAINTMHEQLQPLWDSLPTAFER